MLGLTLLVLDSKLHKTPQNMYIAGSSSTKILFTVKDGQQASFITIYSRSGINHIWILNNSKDLLQNIKPTAFRELVLSQLLTSQHFTLRCYMET